MRKCFILTTDGIYLFVNQEDSLILNQAAIQRGLFNGSKFTFYKAELDQKEKLGNPDVTKTENIKSANYSKLVDGVVQRGTRIQEDDVLIGKFTTMPKGAGRDAKSVYSDKSLVYRDSEEAVVQQTIVGHNEEAMRFAKVGLRKIRPVNIGDKFCLLPTAEVLTDGGWISLSNLDITNVKIATLNPANNALSYETATEKHVFNYDSAVDGKLHSIKTAFIHTVVTPNHKNFVKLPTDKKFSLQTIENCRNLVQFKRNCNNYIVSTAFPPFNNYPVAFIARLISDWILYSELDNNNEILPLKTYQNDLDVLPQYFSNEVIVNNITIDSIRKYIIKLSEIQSLKIIDKLNVLRKHSIIIKYHAYDVLQQLTLQAGYSLNIIENYPSSNCVDVKISKINSEPLVDLSNFSDEYKEIDYVGQVMCVDVPNHIFYYRESRDSPACWTGNSSRSG